MGKFYETIPASTIKWVMEQGVFWVATAPLSGSGHVNVSPKGGPYFGIIDEKTFWYMDLTGSGSETISHLYEPGNGRITIMFNAFVGPPKIVRLWGYGRVLENGTEEFSKFISQHEVKTLPGSRSIIVVDIHQVGSSCGMSVPYYDFKAHRPLLNEHFAKKEEKFKAGKTDEAIEKYWALKNSLSMDQLPAMKKGLETGKKETILPMKKMVGPLAPKAYPLQGGAYRLVHLLIVAAFGLLLGALLALYGPYIATNGNLRMCLGSKAMWHPSSNFGDVYR